MERVAFTIYIKDDIMNDKVINCKTIKNSIKCSFNLKVESESTFKRIF